MRDPHDTGIDSPLDEGVRTYAADAAGLPTVYVPLALASFQVPILIHADNRHERLFIAAFDGTGNDKLADPTHKTNVGLISDQVEALIQSGEYTIGGNYVAGTGTQANPITRLFDGASGFTIDERTEYMYKKFIEQAWAWKQVDPDVEIRIAGVGFSRGAEEEAMFARMVEQRGIQDSAGAIYTVDEYGQIKHVEYTRPALVPAGQVAQAVVLLDPVATGQPTREDRRLPPSVISGIQFTAMDEHRALFKADHIIDPGMTADGRFAGINLPGAHSDVGGGYLLDGLPIRAGNQAINYLNELSDKPFLKRMVEPQEARSNVIHRSEQGMLLYRLDNKVERFDADGYNELLVSRHNTTQVADPSNAEHRNGLLNAQFDRQSVREWQPLQASVEQPLNGPKPALDQLIDQLYQGALHNDDRQMDAAASAYLRTPHGQAWQEQAMHGEQAVWMQQAIPCDGAQPSMAQQAPVMQQ